MMRAVALGAVFLLLGGLEAHSGVELSSGGGGVAGAPPVPGVCPMGNVDPNDGCPGANQTATWRQPNAFQSGDYFNTLTYSPYNYMRSVCGVGSNQPCRPQRNVAGVDYPIGVWMTTLKDPVTNPPAGCSVVSNNAGASSLTCNNSAFQGVIQGYEFGPIGGHGCMGLNISGTPAAGVTNLVIDNVHWFNDTGNCISTLGSQKWLRITSSAYNSGTTTISNSYFDGNAGVWDELWGPVSANCPGVLVGGTQCNPQAFIDSPGNIVVQYSVFKDFAGSIFNIQASTTITIQYSWIQTWCVRIPNCHAEWYNWPSSIGGVALAKFDHDVITASGGPTGNSQFGPSPMQVASGWPSPIGDWQFNYNTQINPYVGGYAPSAGGNGTVSGCAGGKPTGGTDVTPTCDTTTPDNTFYVTKQSAPLGHGLLFGSAGCAGGFSVGIYQHIAGPYTGTTPAIIDEWSMDSPVAGNNAAFSPNFKGTGASCTNAPVSAHVANNGVFSGHGPTPYTNSSVTNNYIDASSQGGTTPSLWTWGNVTSESGVASFPGTVTGGTTLTTTTSPALVNLISVVAPGLGNCSIDTGHCPRIASGSGNSWVLDTAVADFSGNMTGVRTEWCVNPTVFGGNVDMSGTMSSTWMNQWSGHGPNAYGC